MDFHMSMEFLPTIMNDCRPNLDVGRPDQLFEIAFLSTPHIYDARNLLNNKYIQRSNIQKKKNPAICRKFYDKWNMTGYIYNKEFKDKINNTEKRLMWNVYGVEGTGKSIYGALKTALYFDDSFVSRERIRNTERELIELIPTISNANIRGFKFIMRDERPHNVGPDSWTSVKNLESEMTLYRIDQMGLINVGTEADYGYNYHFVLRMIDSTFAERQMPAERFESEEERVDWILSEPHYARAVVSTLKAKFGTGWKQQEPFGFVALPCPGMDIKKIDGKIKYSINKREREALIDYHEFKKEFNKKSQTSSTSANDYGTIFKDAIDYLFGDVDKIENNCRFFFKMSPVKDKGKVISSVNKLNMQEMFKTLAKTNKMWRNTSTNVLIDMTNEFAFKCNMEFNIMGKTVEELIMTNDIAKIIYEEYEKATGNIGTETLSKEEYAR